MLYTFCCIVGRESHFGEGILRLPTCLFSVTSIHETIQTLAQFWEVNFKILQWGLHCSIKHFYQFANVSSLLYVHLEDLSPTHMWVSRRLGRGIFFRGGGRDVVIIDVKTLSLRYCTFLKCRYSATSVLGITWTLFHNISE